MNPYDLQVSIHSFPEINGAGDNLNQQPTVTLSESDSRVVRLQVQTESMLKQLEVVMNA